MKPRTKTCSRGHTFTKSSDCPVCPFCWSGYYKNTMGKDFPSDLSAPALRALLHAKITTVQKLAAFSEEEILALHGIGPSSIPKLSKALKEQGLTFKKTIKMEKYDTVDEYIASFSGQAREELERLRSLIKKLMPHAQEGISYGMPGYKLNKKPVVYFAGWKDHISLYPTPNGMEKFAEELAPYATGKGTAQFSLEEPLPIDLIVKIVEYRIEQVEK